jgi:hypothetical protein
MLEVRFRECPIEGRFCFSIEQTVRSLLVKLDSSYWQTHLDEIDTNSPLYVLMVSM